MEDGPVDELLALHEAKVQTARETVGRYLESLATQLQAHADYRAALKALPSMAEAAERKRDARYQDVLASHRIAQANYARQESRIEELATCRPRVERKVLESRLEKLAARAFVGDRQAVELLAEQLCEMTIEGSLEVLRWRNLKLTGLWSDDPLQQVLEGLESWTPFTPRAVQSVFRDNKSRSGAVTALLSQLARTGLPCLKLDSKPPAKPQLPAVVPPKKPKSPPPIDLFERWKGDLRSAWEGHLESLGPSHPGSLLVGYSPVSGEPLFVPREVFHEHAYTTGPSGSGKTSGALMPIFIQLLRGSDETEGAEAGESPPMLIIDLKGDTALFHTARLEARKRGKQFHLLTAMPGFDSSYFNPIQSLRSLWEEPPSLAETLCSALELYHGTGYGAGFYSAYQASVLAGVIDQGLQEAQAEGRLYEPSFDDMVERLGRFRDRDAKHVQAVLRCLTREPFRTLLSPPSDTPKEKVINMDRVVSERQVVYVYVPSHRSTITGATIARLALHCLYYTLAEREHTARKIQSYVIADEFQELAAYNLSRIAQKTRSFGLGLIMANQSVSDLVSPNMDLRDVIQTNTAYRQFFGAATLNDIDLISRLSGEQKVLLRSDGIQASVGTQDTEGAHTMNHRGGALVEGSATTFSQALRQQLGQDLTFTLPGDPRGVRYAKHIPGRAVPSNTLGNSLSWAQTLSEARGEGSSRSHTDMRTLGLGTQVREVYRPRLTVDDLNAMTAERLSSIVHVRLNTPSFPEGRCAAVQALYTTDKDEYDERSAAPWPRAMEPPQEAVHAYVDSTRSLFGERADRLRALFGNRLP